MKLEDKLKLMCDELDHIPHHAIVDVRWLNDGEVEHDLTIQLYPPSPLQEAGYEDDAFIFYYVSDVNDLKRLFHPSHEDFEIIDITDIY